MGIPKRSSAVLCNQKILLPSTRGICMSVTPGEQPRPHSGCFYCLSKMDVFPSKLHCVPKGDRSIILAFVVTERESKWWGDGCLGQRERCSRSEAPPLGWFFSRRRKSLEWKCSKWPWRNLSPGFDSQGVLDTWEIQPSPWELSPRQLQNQFTFVQWYKDFSGSREVKSRFVSLGDSGICNADLQPHQIYVLLKASRLFSIF